MAQTTVMIITKTTMSEHTSSGSSSSRRGVTRAYQFNSKHKTDFERICAEEDRQMQEKGWQIISDRIDMPQSHNIRDLACGDKKQ
ncbi:MAG TPA: hypothetical protein VE521_00020 [Nitrososphaera sp.]|nr:hypothetical protein [Nitrososphaera sp.]